jgi:hypothetical protein
MKFNTKNILSSVLFLNVALWSSHKIIGMNTLPSEIIEQIIDDIRVSEKIPHKALCKTESKYELKRGQGVYAHEERILPTSFGRSELHICRSERWDNLQWPSALNHLLETPSKVYIGFLNTRYPNTSSPQLSLSASIPGKAADDNVCHVDSNELGKGFVSFGLSNMNMHKLCFFDSVEIDGRKGDHPFYSYHGWHVGIVTALIMHPKLLRVVYLTDNKVDGTTLQRMVVAHRKANNTLAMVVSAPTPDLFKEIVPFDTNDLCSHFALSEDGKIWKIFGGENNEVQYNKQFVYDKEDTEKTYLHLAANESKCIATLNNKGEIFVSDSELTPQRMLLYVDTIPNVNKVIRFSFTGNTIRVVHDKEIFGDHYPVTCIDYNPMALFLNYVGKVCQRSGQEIKKSQGLLDFFDLSSINPF